MFIKYGNLAEVLLEGNIDKTKSLVINSCGTYRLYTHPELHTGRPEGRLDYQLIYIASGKGHFYFGQNTPLVLPAGHMVLYRPGEPQDYTYYGKDNPEIYWIHFTGADVEHLLSEHGISSNETILFTGTDPAYAQFFEKIILELQLKKEYFVESTALLLHQLLLTAARAIIENRVEKISISSTEIIEAASYFHEHYRENINVEAYIESKYFSTSSFFRKFKLYTGMTPLQYLLDIRLSNARNLLESTDYTIGEIAALVGYDNALYFSRLFHKHVGVAPKEYRKQVYAQIPDKSL